MKYQLTDDSIRPSYPGKPFGWVPEEMRDFVCEREVFQSGKLQKMVFWRTDVVFDNEHGPAAVKQGFAVPMDDECREACELTDRQIEAAQKAYPRTKAGIHPEDFDAYDKGYMIGYQPDGAWLPGPNHEVWLEEQRAIEEEDDV